MIYFIQAKNGGPIKIGYTENDIEGRLNAIQTAAPYPLILLGFIEGNKASEQSLHERFSEHHLHGEWFHPDKEIKIFIVENCKIKIYKPLPKIPPNLSDRIDLKKEIEKYECSILTEALSIAGNNKKKAAYLLKLSYRSLRHRLSKYRIKTY